MKMYKRVAEYLQRNGLLDGFVLQYLIWRDVQPKQCCYAVFRPNGGSVMEQSLGNEYHVLLDLVGPANEAELIDNAATRIVEYIKNHPLDDCVGQIQTVGGVTAPVLLDDGRLVYRLLLTCTFG